MALAFLRKCNHALYFLFLFFFGTARSLQLLHSSPSTTNPRLAVPPYDDGCQVFEFEDLANPESKCSCIQSQQKQLQLQRVPHAYIDYLRLYYCAFEGRPLLGYTLLALWLLLLFYLLGNTASQYFCSSLESLSRVLRLSPSIAGVTLLSLGNGAPDVFSIIVSFTDSGAGEVGLSSVLGGAFFVSTVVVGIISLCVHRRAVHIDRSSFLRDACFFMAVLCCLLAVLLVGKIGLWGSLCFSSLYVVYVFVVSTTHICRQKRPEMAVPLLDGVVVEEPLCNNQNDEKQAIEDFLRRCCCNCNYNFNSSAAAARYCLMWVFRFVDMPLYLPRRLTIPDVSEERWSKPFAVASAGLSPLLLATLWNSQREETGATASAEESLTIYMVGGLVGMVLGIAALETTECSNPPRKCLFPWLAGGFLMSVIWAYITARELVSLLVSIGVILGISPSILGLTVLAWGNSIGDLIANVAMAVNGGQDGAQIAISGCYAGPIFNTLVGLGVSLVFSSWSVHPSPFVIPKDLALFETLVFLIGGLLWALLMLPGRDMKLDKVLGGGLLAIYTCFLCLRISESLGLLQIRILFHLR